MTQCTKMSSPATPRHHAPTRHPHPGILEVALVCARDDPRSRTELAHALELCEAVIDRWLSSARPSSHRPDDDDGGGADERAHAGDEDDVGRVGHGIKPALELGDPVGLAGS